MNTMNSNTLKIKYNKFIIFNLLIALIIIIIGLLIYLVDIQLDIKLSLYSWIGNILLLWGILLFKKIKQTHINPYTFFFISYFFFSYGQLFLYSFGLSYDKYNLISIFSKQEIINYCLYFTLGTCFFLIGGLTAIKKDILVEKKNISSNYYNDFVLRKSLKITAWMMFLISAPVYLNNLILNVISSINYGYISIYDITDSSVLINILSSMSMWFVPSIFILLTIYKQNSYLRKVGLLILSLIVIAGFVIGVRGDSLAIILSTVYLWDSQVKKIKKKNKVLIMLLMLIIIALLPVIQEFRVSNNKSLTGFIIALYSMRKNDNLFISFIGELGGSMYPWLQVKRLLPKSYSFKLGQSYIASFLAIIPSFLIGGFSFSKYAHLSGWLQEAANMTYGPGFSILAEAYYNFGWFGIPILFIIGWIYFKFLSNNMLKGNIIIYKNLFSAISLYGLVMSTRGSLYLVIRTQFYVILIPILIIKLISNTKNRNNN